MILFPNCKINIGLHVNGIREDGYHDISTIMVPVAWCDVLEIVPSRDGESHFELTGSALGGCPPEKNLVIKAVKALEAYLGRELPPLEIYLRKVIPDGAGLGGGSADASFTLLGINRLLDLGLDNDTLALIASRIGADCSFFIYNEPMLAEGIGERLTPIRIDNLKGKYIAIAKPAAESVSTKEAYSKVDERRVEHSKPLTDCVATDIVHWRDIDDMVNDFEIPISEIRPVIGDFVREMYRNGACYSAMSGSGSAVYGIFDDVKLAESAVSALCDAVTYVGRLQV